MATFGVSTDECGGRVCWDLRSRRSSFMCLNKIPKPAPPLSSCVSASNISILSATQANNLGFTLDSSLSLTVTFNMKENPVSFTLKINLEPDHSTLPLNYCNSGPGCHSLSPEELQQSLNYIPASTPYPALTSILPKGSHDTQNKSLSLLQLQTQPTLPPMPSPDLLFPHPCSLHSTHTNLFLLLQHIRNDPTSGHLHLALLIPLLGTLFPHSHNADLHLKLPWGGCQ